MEKKCHLDNNDCEGIPVEPINNYELKGNIRKNGEVYSCGACNTVIKHINNLSRHRKFCEGSKSKAVFSCVICTKEFAYASKLKEHQKTHDRSIYNCEKCYQQFKRNDNFQKHTAKCSEVRPSMLLGNGSTGVLNSTINDIKTEQPDEVISVENQEGAARIYTSICSVDQPSMLDIHSIETVITSVVEDDSYLDWQQESYEESNMLNGNHSNQPFNIEFEVVDVDSHEQTPPRKRQNRLAKPRQRMVFDINQLLGDTESTEKQKILQKALDTTSDQMDTFYSICYVVFQKALS